MNWELVTTTAQLADAEAYLASRNRVFYDTETTGLRWWTSRVFMMSFSDGERTFVVPTRHHAHDRLVGFLTAVFANPNQEVCAQNWKFDAHQTWRTFGVNLCRNRVHDTMVAAFLLDENADHHLKPMLKAHLGMPIEESDAVRAWLEEHHGAQANWRFDQVPEDVIAPYAARDAFGGFRLLEHLEPLVKRDFAELYATEMGLLKVLVKMERAGVPVDPTVLEGLKVRYEAERAAAVAGISLTVDGRPIDLDSPQQVAHAVYEVLKLPVKRLTDKGVPSTDDWALEPLAAEAPFVASLLRYRAVNKLLTTYVEPMLEYRDAGNLVHADYSTTRARTGRFACGHPNLQNVIKDADFRRAFTYAPGTAGYYLDYGQVEARGMAHYSGDGLLRDAFRNEVDPYVAVAAEVFGVAIADVTALQRKAGKGIFLSTIYGVGKAKLRAYVQSYVGDARVVTEAEAESWKRRFFARFARVRSFIYDVQSTVKRDRPPFGHHVRNAYGRVRRLDPAKAYTGVNHLIQGWAADVMKAGMVRIDRELGLTFRQNIHDAVRIDLPFAGEHPRELLRQVAHRLCDVPGCAVPLTVETEWSATSWADVQKLKLEEASR